MMSRLLPIHIDDYIDIKVAKNFKKNVKKS
jgi:hypothetical protein